VSDAGGLVVREIMGEPFPCIGVDTPFDVVIPLLMHY